MFRKTALLVSGLFFSVGASAEGQGGYLDLFYIPKANVEITDPGSGSFDDDGDGFGFRGLAPLSDGLAITGEYQTVGYDEFDFDYDQLRFGIGLADESRSGVYIEYIKTDRGGAEADGFAIHARMESVSEGASFYGQLGYAMLNDDTEDLNGLEFLAGLTAPLGTKMRGFVDYRQSTVKGDDSDVEFEFGDIRAGIRIAF